MIDVFNPVGFVLTIGMVVYSYFFAEMIGVGLRKIYDKLQNTEKS